MTLSTDAATRKDRNSGNRATLEHRHFAVIARILANASGHLQAHDWEWLAQHFAHELASTNPRFDRQRFLTACGLEG